jgi:hypothetical protein
VYRALNVEEIAVTPLFPAVASMGLTCRPGGKKRMGKKMGIRRGELRS